MNASGSSDSFPSRSSRRACAFGYVAPSGLVTFSVDPDGVNRRVTTRSSVSRMISARSSPSRIGFGVVLAFTPPSAAVIESSTEDLPCPFFPATITRFPSLSGVISTALSRL